MRLAARCRLSLPVHPLPPPPGGLRCTAGAAWCNGAGVPAGHRRTGQSGCAGGIPLLYPGCILPALRHPACGCHLCGAVHPDRYHYHCRAAIPGRSMHRPTVSQIPLPLLRWRRRHAAGGMGHAQSGTAPFRSVRGVDPAAVRHPASGTTAMGAAAKAQDGVNAAVLLFE